MAEPLVTPAAEGAPTGQGASNPPANSGGQPSGTPLPNTPPSTGAQAGQPEKEPEFEIKVDGQTRKVTRSEAIELAQKGHAFTQKTQELADHRRKLEQQYNSAVQKAIAEERAKWEKERETPPDPTEQVQTQVQQLANQMADEKMDRVLAELKGKYPLLNEELFLLEANRAKAGWGDLDGLAKTHQEAREAERSSSFESLIKDEKNPKVAAYRQSVIDEYLKAKEKESKPKSETGSAGIPGGSTGKARPTNMDDAHQRAKEMLGIA